jgi:hypothetical protein
VSVFLIHLGIHYAQLFFSLAMFMMKDVKKMDSDRVKQKVEPEKVIVYL